MKTARRVIKTVLVFGILVFVMGADTGSSSSAGDVLGVLREFGFPIFVSLWFMWRVEKKLDRFTDAIQNLLTVVTIQTKTIESKQRSGTNAELTK